MLSRQYALQTCRPGGSDTRQVRSPVKDAQPRRLSPLVIGPTVLGRGTGIGSMKPLCPAPRLLQGPLHKMQMTDGQTVQSLWVQLPQPAFGRAVAVLRAAIDGAGRDLPREVLAGKMRNVATGYVGLDATTIWRWESGRTDARRHYRSMIGDV